MAQCLQFQELENIDYNFEQTSSLEQTFDSWGRCGNSYLKIDINGVSYTQLNVFRVLQEASSIMGVSQSNIISIKAPQASSDITGIVSLNNAPTVKWAGHSMMLGVSYLNIDSQQEYGVFTYSFIDGSLKLIEQATGEFKTFLNIDGSINSTEKTSGEFAQSASIEGSRNIVELLSGLK